MADETESIRLDCDERYPDYHEARSGGHHVDAPADVVARWRKVMTDYAQVQDEMMKAYDAAVARDAEDQRMKKAEAEVATAQMRLDRARREQAHRPDNPASWEFIGDGAIPCGGIQYVDERDARAERMRLHTEWPGITFDFKPYRCAQGHWHLGRSS